MSELTPALLWLIPGAPLLASLLIAFFGKALLRGRSHVPCVAALAVSTVIAGFLNLMFLASPGSLKPDPISRSVPGVVASEEPHAAAHSEPKPLLTARGYEWSVTDNLQIRVDLQVDAMTVLMLATVTFVSLLVAIYAAGYMHGDPGYARFFAEFALFVFSMSMLVMADNFLSLFVFWEAVGLCSYLLIGFWFQRPSAAAAARKAFVVNRIGDFGFILGIFLIWKTFGTVNFAEVFERIPVVAQSDPAIFTTICLLLFLGAMGKSAQFPLHVWLPDAMEGPTPVSALIHAATMVTAGVYLVARCTPLFAMAPNAQMVVSGIGAVTALLAALTALTQYDLKRVLAYSTVSQLGYMFMALGAASLVYTKKDGTHVDLSTFAVTAAMFHLFTHAFFKALLFLAAGSVMHGMGDVIDMRRFSGLRHVMPQTRITFLVGALTLAGCPLLAGFWSKDEILVALFEGSQAGGRETFFTVILAVAIVTAFLTAFYSFRAYNMTFLGEERFPDEAHHPHESPAIMTLPLFVLAGFSLVIGLFLGPTGVYARMMAKSSVLEHGQHAHSWMLMGLSAVIFGAGFGLARWLYVQAPGVPAKLETALKPLHRLSLGKFFFDELFTYLIVVPVKVVALLCTLFDNYLIDGVLDFLASIPATVGRIVRPIQNGFVSNYAWAMLLGLVLFLIQILRAWAG